MQGKVLCTQSIEVAVAIRWLMFQALVSVQIQRGVEIVKLDRASDR